MKLTQEHLKSLLSYDQGTGVFVWIASGGVAGEVYFDRYKYIYIDGMRYRAHRLAWLYVHGSLPDCDIDHINGNGLDNRIENLRLAERYLNNANRKLDVRSTTGYKGVYFNKKRNRFIAQLNIKSKTIHLGSHLEAQHAAHAYNKAAIEHFGEYACLNPIGHDYVSAAPVTGEGGE